MWGFPGETEEQFEELLDFVKNFQFDCVGCFTYSHEAGTPSARMENPVPEKLKALRHDRLMKLQKKISFQRGKMKIGTTVPVLVEGLSEETPWLLKARHWQQAPEIDGLTYINDGYASQGEIIPVKITHSHDYDFVGKSIKPKDGSLRFSI